MSHLTNLWAHDGKQLSRHTWELTNQETRIIRCTMCGMIYAPGLDELTLKEIREVQIIGLNEQTVLERIRKALN